jgi:hypothetical protein
MKNGQPRFVTTGPMGASMQLEPPFDFDGVTLRVFPLRANLYRLQRFVDDYLNIVPPQVARFRVPLPYAFMSLINYGKMSVDAANMGWIAQREILFCIPLEWYVLVGGKYVFKGWAFVSPFIYVDNELSMATGRNVYGWPKSLALLDAELNAWMENPRARSRLATASTMVFPEAYAGRRQEQRVFLEVQQSLGPSPLQVPPDLGGAAMPWVAIPNAIRSSASLMRDYVGLFGAMGLTERQPYVGPAAYAAMAQQIGRDVNPFAPGLAFNTMNLKQFRSADRADAVVAYQALTNARMEMKAYKNGGLMGDGNMLLGDSSGGFRVVLHRYKATPIIECLGLEVDSEWQGNGASVASLKPVFPYWLDLDMRYNRGETLAWRTKETAGWKVGCGDEAKQYVREGEQTSGPIRNPYNTSTAGASQEIGGALVYPDTTFCVLPLMADEKKLKQLLDGYLNEPLKSEGMVFKPWGRYVYLVVANHTGVSSDANNVGSWADHDVKVHVAVKWYENKALRGVALVPIFAYANSTTATITSTEVTGIPVMKAVVECPNGTWLDASGPGEATTDPLLRMTTTVLPALGEGQGAQVRVLLEIKDGSIPGLDTDTAWRRAAETWGQTLKEDLAAVWEQRRKEPRAFDDALSLPLEVFGNGLPINILTLKQFRETSDPAAACYQSLVLHRWGVDQVHDVREIEGNLYACIHEYPTQPIVKTLGLVAKHVTVSGAARAHYVEPVRPFWFRQSQTQNLGITIRRRAGSEKWERDADTEALIKNGLYEPYFSGDPVVSTGLGARIYPQGIRAQVREVVPVGVAPGGCAPCAAEGDDAPCATEGDDARRVGEKIPRKMAVEAVEAMEPQVILGAMLSREWENWGKPRWAAERDAIKRDIDEEVKDVLPEEVAAAEVGVLRLRLDRRNSEAHSERWSAHASRRKERDALYFSLAREAETLARLTGDRRPMRSLPAGVAGGTSIDPVTLSLVHDVVFAVSHDGIYRSLLRVLDGAAAEARSPDEAKRVAQQFAAIAKAVKGAIGALAEERKKTESRVDPKVVAQWQERVEFLLPRIRAQSEVVRRRLRAKVVEDVKQEYERCRDALIYELAIAAQKPDHCIRRDTLASPAQEYVFPEKECWDHGTERWYVGKPVHTRAPAVLILSAAAGSVDVPSTSRFDDWDEAEALGSIRHVTVWAGDVVDAVRVGYALRSLEKHGGTGGGRHDVALEPGETLVGLSLSHGEYFGAHHLCGVTLEIRGKGGTTRTAGPFGSGGNAADPMPSRIKAPAGEQIAALAGGSYLHSDGMEALTTLRATFASPADRVSPPEPPPAARRPQPAAARPATRPSPRRG